MKLTLLVGCFAALSLSAGQESISKYDPAMSHEYEFFKYGV